MRVKIILSHQDLVFQEAPLLCLSFSQQTLHLLQLGHIWSAGTADKTTKTDTLESESLQTCPCFFSGGTFAENLSRSCKGARSDISIWPFLVHTACLDNRPVCLPFQQKGCILLSILLIIHCLCVCVCVCWIRGNPLGKWANLSIWTCFFLLCPSPSTVCAYSSLL